MVVTEQPRQTLEAHLWRGAAFRIVGLILTLVGVVVLGFHYALMHASGTVTYPGMLLYCFPICGLFWDWPPHVNSASGLLLVICIGAHWPLIGWACDRLRCGPPGSGR